MSGTLDFKHALQCCASIVQCAVYVLSWPFVLLERVQRDHSYTYDGFAVCVFSSARLSSLWRDCELFTNSSGDLTSELHCIAVAGHFCHAILFHHLPYISDGCREQDENMTKEKATELLPCSDWYILGSAVQNNMARYLDYYPECH